MIKKFFKSKNTKVSESLVLNKTHNTPAIRFEKNGKIEFKGRLIPEDANDFFDVLIKWIPKIESNEICIDFKLDYINTTSTKCLYKFLKEFDETPSIKTVSIDWHYEKDDYDLKEIAQLISNDLQKATFNYKECLDLDID